MISNTDLIQRLKNITEVGRGCLCGHSEWCENCSPSSVSNQIRKEIRALIEEIEGLKSK